MNNTVFHVKKRDITSKPRHLRNLGYIPANIYGGEQSVPIQIEKRELIKKIKESQDAQLIYLQVDSEKTKVPALLDEIQAHPVNNEFVHVAFRQVDLKEKVTAEIGVDFVGELDVRDGMLVVVKDFVEVSALPTDLPDTFEVEVGALTQVGDVITTESLKFDSSKVSLVEVVDGEPITLAVVQSAVQEEIEDEGEVEGEGSGDDKSDVSEGGGESDSIGSDGA